MIVGFVAAALITILRAFVALPAVFVALTVMLYVPDLVGVPEIVPVLEVNLTSDGKLPLEIDQVIGVVPFALSVVL